MNEDILGQSPNTTTLRDGRIVVMRELTGTDEYTVEKFMAKEGYKPDSFAMILYVKLLAMTALVSVGNDQYPPVKTLAELILRLSNFTSKELAAILKLYNTVNGRGDDEEGNDNG